jgi:hypothetical protein
LRIEIESLLNTNRALDDHISFLELQLKKLKQRIEDSLAVMQLVQKMRKEGKISKDIARAIEEKYPYDLNSQKKLTEFYSEMPQALREWVLDVAIPKRTKQIWEPMAEGLERHLTSLKKMKAGSKAISSK